MASQEALKVYIIKFCHFYQLLAKSNALPFFRHKLNLA